MNYLKIFLIQLITIFTVNSEEGSVSTPQMAIVTPLELIALGRVAVFGDIYDERSDQFLHISIFSNSLPENEIITTQNLQTKYKYSFINTMEEKFSTMDISAGLKLSVLGGLCELQGSGKFLKDTKTSAKSSKASLILSISTEYQKISITDTEVQQFIDFNALQQIDATHVVVGIQWGGNLFISVEDQNKEDKDHQSVEGNLKAKLEYLYADISGYGEVKIDDKSQQELSKFKFEMFGDILPINNPQTLIDAVKFMKNATTSLQTANNGRGKAMKYTLIPIIILRNLLKLKIETNSLLIRVDDATVKNCVNLFDDINRVEQRLNDLAHDLTKYEKQISTVKVEQVKMTKSEYEIYKLEAQKNLSSHLVLVRSGKELVGELQEVIKFATEHPYSWLNVQMKDFSEIESEIRFLKLMSKMNVTLLDKDKSLEEFLFEKYEYDVYILFYSKEFSKVIEKSMKTFRDMIHNKPLYGDLAIFAMVKNELFNYTETKVSLYRKLELVIDYYEVNTEVPDINKPELWSFYFMQTQLANILSNPVPVGFIYVQMKDQKSPEIIWPNVNWSDVTSEYAGLFFRAEGDNSSSFGLIQEEFSPAIIKVETKLCHEALDQKEHDIHNLNGWSEMIWMGATPLRSRASFDNSLKIYAQSGEVRPRNTAIKIWKRI